MGEFLLSADELGREEWDQQSCICLSGEVGAGDAAAGVPLVFGGFPEAEEGVEVGLDFKFHGFVLG